MNVKLLGFRPSIKGKRYILFSLAVVLTVGAGAYLLYPRSRPHYGLLLFGPARLRVWVALDGEAVSIDREGGDVPRKGQRFARLTECKDIDIPDPDGTTHYVITHLGDYQRGDPPRPYLIVNVDIRGPVAYRQYGDLEMRDSPANAAVAHFHGPLTAGPETIRGEVPPKLALKTGDLPTDLPAHVGTFNREQGCWVVVRSHNSDASAWFPGGICPVVVVEFPAKVSGDPPIKKRYALDKVC